MNNDIIDFFQPRSETYYFLGLMVLVFGVGAIGGWLRYRRSRALLEVAVGRYTSNLHECAVEAADRYLLIQAQPDQTQRWLGPVPGILVTLGILGTFIGIGIAISHAIPALQSGTSVEEVQTALAQLLGAVKFKFQTSAWGIIFSLSFLVFATRLEMSLRSRIEQSTSELLSLRRDPMATLLSGLPSAVQGAITEGFSHLSRRMESSLEALSQSTVAMKREAATIAVGVNVLQATVNKFSGTVENASTMLTSASRELGDLGTKVDASLTRVSAVLKERLVEMEAGQKAAFEAIGRTQRDAFTEATAGIHTSQEAMTAAQRQSFERVEASLKMALTRLSTSVDQLHRDLDENLRAQGDRAAASHENMQRSVSSALAKLEGAVGEFRTQAAEGQRLQQAALEGSLKGLKQELKDALTSMEATIAAMATNQGRGLDDLKKYQNEAASSLKHLSSGIDQLNKHTDAFLKIAEKLKMAAPPSAPPSRGGGNGGPSSCGFTAEHTAHTSAGSDNFL